ncbi:MAG: V-type ATP synthase subunit D [Candidatus Gracilibacteria bacterium]|jgi:V/A-type H+-transporting ATPase subunit D|nr:V-type ATP synthase subunit D [Candidatus Gracilibacteria bacterium]
MAILKINPTRMNLLNLKKQIKTAKRGHKLLKDKRDGLMKKFMEIIKEARDLRREVEKEVGDVFSHFLSASSSMSSKEIESALMLTTASIDLEVETKNIMSVRVPEFKGEFSGNVKTYSPSFTSGELDIALDKLQKVFPLLLRLSEVEKKAEAMAEEIETTRRRVNALEYKRIPDLKDTLRFITIKLEEMARDSLVSVMRVKSMIEEKEKQAAREKVAV